MLRRVPWWLLVCIPMLCGCIGPDVRDWEGKVTESTPYGHKYERVKRYLTEAAAFRYQRESFGDYWQSPEQTEQRGGGDCEDLAIWLYAKLVNAGFADVRLVAGMMFTRKGALVGWHAWAQWHSVKGVYILDPTTQSGWPTPTEYTPRWWYQPRYSWYRDTRYAHEWTPPEKTP